MKKLIVILLLLVYGLSASGSTIYVHFCCGKIDAVKLIPVKNSKCPVDHKIKKPGCCDDKQLDLKISSDQKREVAIGLYLNVPSAIPPSFELQRDSRILFDQASHRHSSSPPVHYLCNLYKLHCIYRI